MEKNNNPLTPHLQIYKWQISSLLSITHRIVGIVNIIAITLICLWSISLLLGEANYEIINYLLNTFFGKFLIISFCWTFSFHILSEIRHLSWDLGYGFDLKTSKITGVLVIIGSFILTIMIYLIGKNII
jgi:succinate dehydrogenase / fumarate reductase cytochrome b subunit